MQRPQQQWRTSTKQLCRCCGRSKPAKSAASETSAGEWLARSSTASVHPPRSGYIEAPHYHASAAFEAEIAGLRQVAELLRGQLEATRQDRDRWAEAATAALSTLPAPAKSRRFGGVAASHDFSDRVMILKAPALAVAIALVASTAGAQDVPGVELCTVEKSMVRRTSCLQSNVDFLQKLISKNAPDSQQKLDAASRAIDDLKSAVAILQKSVSQLQAAEKERK